jgi:hypothetical protein
MRSACVRAVLGGRGRIGGPRRSRAAWLLAAALACGCADERSAIEPAPVPPPPSDPAAPGKVRPAPATEVALGRTVLEALQRDDWDAYANLLATRADMLELYADEALEDGARPRDPPREPRPDR